jgi:hypothetical protein
VAPQPVGLTGDATAREAPESPSSVQLVEETAQPETATKTAASETTGAPPDVLLPVTTIQPEPAINAIVQEIPLRLTVPDLCIPLTVRGVPLDDVRRSSAIGDPPELATIAEAPGQDMLLMVAPSAPDCPPTPPEPSTGMDDQKISPMEELAQGFTAVTLVIDDKPPDQPLERPKTPRAFADKDRECYYVTTDYGSSDDGRDGAKPPEHRVPWDAQRDSAAAFVASPLTCDEQSLCTKSRRKANETFVQTISTGVPGRDLDLKVMFDAKLPRTLISYEAASDAALNPSGDAKFVVGADIDVDWSECRFTIPMVDCEGRTRNLKARGVEYTVYYSAMIVPPNASMVFPEMAGPPLTAHQSEGIVHVIVGRDNLQWHPRRVRESPRVVDNLTLFASRFPPEYMVKQTVLAACDGTTHTPRRRRRRRRLRRKPGGLKQ